MSVSPESTREAPARRDGTEDEAVALARGLEALAFLERSRELAAEPVDPPAGPLTPQPAPGPARPRPSPPADHGREIAGRPGESQK